MKRILLLLYTVVLTVLLSSISLAAPAGANISVTDTTTLATYADVGNTTINAGEIKTLEINNTLVSGRWAGFVGQLNGIIRLGDNVGNEFFNWNSQIVGSFIYAANDTTNFENLRRGNATDYPDYLSLSTSDNFSNTFSGEEVVSATGFALDGINTTFATTNSGSGTFKTYSLSDNGTTYILATQAASDETGYDGSNLDFQLILPANVLTRYFFYVELS